MSTSNYPASIDNSSSLPNPTADSETNSPSHSALHTAENDAVKALETKLGTGATTPSTNTILLGTGVGTTQWGQLSSSQFAGVLSDETGSGFSVFNNAPTLVTPKIDTINESTANNGVSVDGLNIKDGVLNSANSVANSNIQAAAVGASNLATNAIVLGYAKITTNFSTTSTSDVQVTGLSLNVSIPSGGRLTRVTAYARSVNNSGAGYQQMTIWDGTVGSGTKISEWQGYSPGASEGGSAFVSAVINPSAGSKTYNIGIRVSAGTGLVECTAAYPAYILVEEL